MKIEYKIETRKIEELIPADYNPRKLTDKEREDLKESIEEFGIIPGIVINIGKRNNTIIGGHQRVKILADMGQKEIKVLVPSRELSKAEEKKLNLRLNKNTGSWDYDKLKEMEIDLLLDVGFGDEELQMFFDDVDVIDDNFNIARAVKDVKEIRVKSGEVWQLGEHRLMLGDSTKKEDVEKLMGEDLADMVYCDPPYNIGLNYSQGLWKANDKNQYGGNYQDNKKEKDYRLFIDTTIKNIQEHTKPNCHMFYWCDERYIYLIQELFTENKVKNQRVCLWIKNNFNMTPQVAFNKTYEPCVYGIKGQPYLNKNVNNLIEVLNKEVGTGNQAHDEIAEMINLWIVKRDNTQDYEHPTQKPITLHEKPMKRCTAPGHIVVDLFGGSGSTLIASQQLGRKCRMMEQDEIFATVILNRFESFSNIKGKKLK